MRGEERDIYAFQPSLITGSRATELPKQSHGASAFGDETAPYARRYMYTCPFVVPLRRARHVLVVAPVKMVAHGIRGDGLEAAFMSETRSEGTYGTRSSQQVCPGTGGRSMEERVEDVSFATRASALEAAVRGRRGVVGQRTGRASPYRVTPFSWPPISGQVVHFLSRLLPRCTVCTLQVRQISNWQTWNHKISHNMSSRDGLWPAPLGVEGPTRAGPPRCQATGPFQAAPPNDAR